MACNSQMFKDSCCDDISYPILILGIAGEGPPLEQQLLHAQIERNKILRVFRDRVGPRVEAAWG
jgi:hypothetical protein